MTTTNASFQKVMPRWDAAHRMRNLTTSSLKNTIFLSHFSATQNSNSCRNSAYMARKNGWTHIHGRIPHHLYYGYRGYSDPHHWPEGSEREGSRRANIIERRLTSTLCFPHFAGSTNSNCRFSKGKKELMLAATSKRALAFQVGAVCYMLCFMSRVMRKSLFPERASTM